MYWAKWKFLSYILQILARGYKNLNGVSIIKLKSRISMMSAYILIIYYFVNALAAKYTKSSNDGTWYVY